MKMPKTLNTFKALKCSNKPNALLIDNVSTAFKLIQNLWKNKIMLGPVKIQLAYPLTIKQLHIRTMQMLNRVQHNAPCIIFAIWFQHSASKNNYV